MRKEFLPNGSYVLIDPKAGPRVSEHGLSFQALVTIANGGSIFSASGRATADLLDKVKDSFDKEYTSFNASAVLGVLDKMGCIKREIKGKRTFRITMDRCVIPRNWWDKMQPYLIFNNSQEPVTDTPEVVQVPPAASVAGISVAAALDNLVDAILLLKESLNIPTPKDDEVSVLREENIKLKSEIDRLSRALRSNPKAAEQFASMGVVDTRSNLNLYALGVKDARLRRLIRHAYDNGFKVEKTGNNHIKLTPPDPTAKIVVTSSTPSDHRVYENFYHDLRRSGMPELT